MGIFDDSPNAWMCPISTQSHSLAKKRCAFPDLERPSQLTQPGKSKHASVVLITALAGKAAVAHVCAPHLLGLCFAFRVRVFHFFANLA
ncbi:hypothetical protein GN958_ATG06630 [Phytophthora infestans]|uniref:Uncharacterized protein n=1 Tax=Phytophthora infestans TaxID=4787 RepID=A0A8S9UT58_PHYIN|nr:hypothetical protein GN958_ATG06630 [Phytophthora infestans]